MAYRIKRGMGGVVDQYPALCGKWGVFKPECWCLEYPSLCSAANYQAAYALANPSVYAPIQAPPVVGSPSGNTPSASTPDDLLAQQKAAWDAQNMATMQQTAANLKAAAQTQCPNADLVQNDDGSWSCPPSSFPWWAVGVAGVLGAIVIMAPSPKVGYAR